MDAAMEDAEGAPVEPLVALQRMRQPLQHAHTVRVSTTGADGAFTLVSQALAARTDPDMAMRIIIAPGTYEEEGLVLQDNLELIADEASAPATDSAVVITCRQDAPVMTSSSVGSYIKNVQIEHRGPFGSSSSLLIEDGDLWLEGCLITGSVSAGVLITGRSTPTILNCSILRCCGDGVKVVDGAEPMLRGCRLYNNDGFGIFCTGSSSGFYEGHSISGNSNAGIATRGTCTAAFHNNKLFSGKQGGFWMEEHSRCHVIGNDIYENQKSGIQVGGYADPLVKGNIVRDGLKGGIVVHDHATGRFVQNEIMRNTMAGVGGTDNACPLFVNNIVKDGKGGGIVLHEKCRGVFEKNQVIGNTHAGIGLKGSSNALFDGNYISDGSGYGVWVQEKSCSTLQNNVIERNMRAGVVVTDTANPTLALNIIRDGKHAGLLIRHSAAGRFRQVRPQMLYITDALYHRCSISPAKERRTRTAGSLVTLAHLRYYSALKHADQVPKRSPRGDLPNDPLIETYPHLGQRPSNVFFLRWSEHSVAQRAWQRSAA